MAIQQLEHLNDVQLDVLKEIGNIGAGNAATSLAGLLNEQVHMTLPNVRIVDVNEAVTLLGGPENGVVGILSRLWGDVEGIMMFLIEPDFAQSVLKCLLGEVAQCERLTDMELSAITEVGNILIAAYTGSISTLSQLKIKSSVPAVAVDMVGAVLSVPAIQMASVSDKVIFIQDKFESGKECKTANMLFVPTIESLNKLMQNLGIEL